jgi:hypothetical protein
MIASFFPASAASQLSSSVRLGTIRCNAGELPRCVISNRGHADFQPGSGDVSCGATTAGDSVWR